MSSRWMIYGANGYTGRLILEVARARGHAPVLAGRDPQRMLNMAKETGLPARIFTLGLKDTARHLHGVDVVLNCAGPFSSTATAMLDACVEAKVSYLDITGEIEVFEMIHGRSAELRAAGVTAIPGVGFDVVPSDCLAAFLKERLPDATALQLAFHPHKGRLSPGTAKTMVEGMAKSGLVRKDGLIQQVPAGYRSRRIAFADGEAEAVTIPWGDVSTAYHSTGIPNVEVYLASTPGRISAMRTAGRFRWLFALPPVQAFLKRRIEQKILGPSQEKRDQEHTCLWGEAVNAEGRSVTLRMRTPDGYSLTAESAVRAVERLLAAPPPGGALTPSAAFGAGFVLELPGCELVE